MCSVFCTDVSSHQHMWLTGDWLQTRTATEDLRLSFCILISLFHSHTHTQWSLSHHMGPNFSRASIRSASTTASHRPLTWTTGLGEIRWESSPLSCNTHSHIVNHSFYTLCALFRWSVAIFHYIWATCFKVCLKPMTCLSQSQSYLRITANKVAPLIQLQKHFI